MFVRIVNVLVSYVNQCVIGHPPRGKNKWVLTPAPEGAKELNNFFTKINKRSSEASEFVYLVKKII